MHLLVAVAQDRRLAFGEGNHRAGFRRHRQFGKQFRPPIEEVAVVGKECRDRVVVQARVAFGVRVALNALRLRPRHAFTHPW